MKILTLSSVRPASPSQSDRVADELIPAPMDVRRGWAGLRLMISLIWEDFSCGDPLFLRPFSFDFAGIHSQIEDFQCCQKLALA